MTGLGKIFVYNLYTFFVGCNASVLPLQHFTLVLNQIVVITMNLAVVLDVCGGFYAIGTQENLSEQQTFLLPYAVMSFSRACAVWQYVGCVGCV